MPAPAPARDRLIGVAMKLFHDKGYGATSIQDILREAGMHAGSLYHAFPTKQELLLAVLERYRDGLYPMLLDPAWEGIADPIERIFALLARYRTALVATDCFYGCPIGSLALELHEPDPPVRALLAVNFDGWTRAIEQCLLEAGARLPPKLNRKELASFVLTVMEGGVMQARTHRTIHAFDAAVRQLREYFARLEAAATAPRAGRSTPRTTPAPRTRRPS
ncbi:MAG TPA: TetR/AcrR family transcriptional regulator [Gemmatimonadales bacterium]|jgi:AcrR family transcriptional regulator|nr:TetR/AcrR family transcriptional regulator [Gemmatimonadales bacterium]